VTDGIQFGRVAYLVALFWVVFLQPLFALETGRSALIYRHAVNSHSRDTGNLAHRTVIGSMPGTATAHSALHSPTWVRRDHADEPLTADWLDRARIAGADLTGAMSPGAIRRRLADLAGQSASVVEADSGLSRFMSERQFGTELTLMRRTAAAAHRLGLKVVWYYPTLEVLSSNARRGRFTMFKNHPDWVQQGLDGSPNVFLGGEGFEGRGRVHWVDSDTESAWMSLHSPYANVFVNRVKQIAATGVDAIWLDVPLFNNLGVEWADAGPAAAAKFLSDTGLRAPSRADWNDPTWRRWIRWRYQEMANFILRAKDAARSVSPSISIIVENVTLDYDAVTQLGLDGSLFKATSGLIQVWEVDAVSDSTGMREARPDDWVALIGMAKFAKAASGKKPSWMFTYGREPDDSFLVMAEALAAGNHPYETKIPQMMSTVGAKYRARMFAWIKEQELRLFASRSAAKIAIFYSPESRDYVDRGAGTGLYATTRHGDDQWWSDKGADSLYALTYLAEYRGLIKWLAYHHVPFDIVVRPDRNELSRYGTLIAPSLTAISDRDATVLDEYVANGGNLILTGPAPAMFDEIGNMRDRPALSALALTDARALETTASTAGHGSVTHTPSLPGKAYMTAGSDAASRALAELLGAHALSPIETDAGEHVHIELRTLGNETLIHLVDPQRLWQRPASASEVTIRLALPPGTTASDVSLTSPGPVMPAARSRDTGTRASQDAGSGSRLGWARKLAYKVEGDRLSFRVPLEGYAMVVVSSRAPAPALGR
jgi:hypothetical protein